VYRAVSDAYPALTLDITPSHKDRVITYKCALFCAQSSRTELTIHARYLTPTMYFRHHLVEAYPTSDDNYYIIRVQSKNNNSITREYYSDGIIPVLFARMLVDFCVDDDRVKFIVLREHDDVVTPLLKTLNEMQKSDDTDIRLMNLLNKYRHTNPFYNDNVRLDVLDNNWRTPNAAHVYFGKDHNALSNWLFNSCSFADFKTINNPCMRDEHANVNVKYGNEKTYPLTYLARHEGGIDVTDIVNSVPDGILYDRTQNVLRCKNKHLNSYDIRESDPITLTIVHEIMKKRGMYTRLTINQQTVFEHIPPNRTWYQWLTHQ